ncbi:hypothetical protein BLNAU_12475 [Blattamonas nauphoetae]|uniref:Uncharacterized protein n=1 Tax=Blattamonas nauphoetae TaxID=2049346 RepID=A0ABQ9XPV1_9EUKA|nr:hypothetical protein BLNAU_12475 [Blattamonas nauphoetae]
MALVEGRSFSSGTESEMIRCSSVPFDADQRFFTSVNERPPSPPNSSLSFFGSESGNEMRTVSHSESTDTGTSQWTNTTQLSSKERLFVVETIHTILSKQQHSDRTPSTLASRPSPLHPIQLLSHSPPFFSSSIFDLDDASLTDCLSLLAEISKQDPTSKCFESHIDSLAKTRSTICVLKAQGWDYCPVSSKSFILHHFPSHVHCQLEWTQIKISFITLTMDYLIHLSLHPFALERCKQNLILDFLALLLTFYWSSDENDQYFRDLRQKMNKAALSSPSPPIIITTELVCSLSDEETIAVLDRIVDNPKRWILSERTGS